MESIHEIDFYGDVQIASFYEGNSSRLLAYRRFAKALMGNEGNTQGNRIWKGLHYKWPFDIYSNLSSCGKTAYLDGKENIKKIIPFLIDNKDGVVFMEGTDEDFLLAWNAILVKATHGENFIETRVKFLVASGIYKWWKDWFHNTRPKKLFPYYANWTQPEISALEKLDFASKFFTTLRIWGICCGGCGLYGICEILLHYWVILVVRTILSLVRPMN
ncbi:hypothetical protein Fcan01_11213 [Folsomia candida]|uniref:Uncharacterized protein n=1 Tax=Folsomia candida TaxID=158441 RepID=A0A226ECF3_FOLCA|nr:hypothetical protein Fcan01_11213 [Folsomia candida]